MKKFDWEHAITRKDYAVLCVLSLIVSMAIYAVGMYKIYRAEIKNWFEKKIKKLNKN